MDGATGPRRIPRRGPVRVAHYTPRVYGHHMEHITQDGRKLEFYPAGANEWLVIDLTAAHAGYAWAYGDQFAVETRRAVVEYAGSLAGALERV